MIIEAGHFKNLPVFSQEGKHLGNISQIIFSSEEPKLIGFLIGSNGFFKNQMAISVADIVAYFRRMIILRSEESLVEIDEIIRIKAEILKNIKFLDGNALDSKNNKIGIIEDILIDTDSGLVLKYYISGYSGKRIFPSEKVLEITKAGIVFSDESEKMGVVSEEMAMI
ncbi:MAG: PRC-barrel domain-containing protein [Patescibacteria group bacterium]|jgi:uncharacterized protein YrrD